ncbi:MAG: sugar ABC transporter permease [Chloroflexota bacterium]
MPKHLTPKQNEALAGYLFILPVYIGFMVFVLWPILEAARISLMDFDLLRQAEYNNFENYTKLVTDARLRTVYRNTIVFALFAVFFNAAIGLALAVLLNQRLPVLIRNFYRSIFFFPILVAHAFVAVIWQFLYQQDTGIVNYYLGFLNVEPISWLGSTQWAMTAVIIMDVWKNTGFAMLVFLAGLQGIPTHFYEAARIDGADERSIFFRITLPLLSPTIFFILVIFSIGAFQVFDSIIVLTNGGPGDATRSIVLYIYEVAFKTFNMGYASALAMTLFVIILMLTVLQFFASQRWVHYE